MTDAKVSGLGRVDGWGENAREDVPTRCYGCAKEFIPDANGIRAGEVLCGKCRRGAEPEPVNAFGVITELDMVRTVKGKGRDR